MNFYECRKLFMQRCIAMNLTDSTLSSYEYFLNSLERLLKKEDCLDDIDRVDSAMLRRYFIMISETMNSITQIGYYRRLKTFFNFLYAEGIIANNPIKNVQKPKAAKRIIQSFDSFEVEKMLDAFEMDSYIGYRNYTIISLLLSTGLRRAEYLSLDLIDIDLRNGFIRVVGKGDKERMVPIGKTLMNILRKFLNKRADFLKGKPETMAVFVSKYGRRMSIGASNSVFRKLRIDLKLEGKRFSAHVWRHTFAKAFLLNGGDVFTLQELMGHADVETTKVYVDLTDSDKKQQNEKFNPLDNRRWRYY